jgi:hypothetical protein
MSEWLKEAVLKTVVSFARDRGFESYSLRQEIPSRPAGAAAGWISGSTGCFASRQMHVIVAERWPSWLKALAC